MKLAIYGTGGAGREIHELALEIQAHAQRWDEVFFIDDSRDGETTQGARVWSFSHVVKECLTPELEIAIAVGEPSVRKLLYLKTQDSNFRLATLVHPSSYVSPTAKIASGSIVRRDCLISCNAELGINVDIQYKVLLGHDSFIGSHSEICSAVVIAGDCAVGEEVFVGQNATIKEGVNIGAHSVLAMGSCLFIDMPEKSMASGNPARIMNKDRTGKVFQDRR